METLISPKTLQPSMKLHDSASHCDIHPFIGFIALYAED